MKRQSAFIFGILIVASCKAKTELNEVTNLNAFEKIAIQIKKSFHKYSLKDNGKNKIFLKILPTKLRSKVALSFQCCRHRSIELKKRVDNR